ncbi:hypothetical protein [Mumia sp. DW29H23]|uniref:hypothetical protein n=1 Tax=Mumia sp. DW29H23 TaxID=3421241 RepID=UPI003D686A73
MRRTTCALLVAGVLVLAGCGGEAPEKAAGSPDPTVSATTPPLAGGERQRLEYASPEALAKHTPVVVLGTVASWEDGPTVVLAERGGGEDRLPYAVMVVDVDQVVKDEGGLVTGDQIAVPVRVAGDEPDARELAPAGSNVAFLGGADTSFGVFGDAEVEIEPGGPVDLDSVLWGESQGVLLETPTGAVVNADPFGRADLWPEIGALPDEEQFGMLAQRLMALG